MSLVAHSQRKTVAADRVSHFAFTIASGGADVDIYSLSFREPVEQDKEGSWQRGMVKPADNPTGRRMKAVEMTAGDILGIMQVRVRRSC